MSEPRWVIAVGACASSGGIFDTYSTLKELTKLYRLTFTYQVVLQDRSKSDGVMKLQELVRTENVRRSSLNTKNYWHLIISNNIMALENTVIQDKLTAAFGEMSFLSKRKISFHLKYLLTKLQRLSFLKNDPTSF
jgi:NADH:ubiquinone oxidoreductase subunit B-like Fe-S oxidoreductase